MNSEKVKLHLDWCSYKAAKYAVEHWHYSKTLPAPPIIKIGVWEDDKFIGCVLFSRGNTQNLGTAYGLSMIEVCELSRVALDKHKSSVTKIISVALLMLKKKEKLKLVVSFADANQSHLGIIYQAGNWVYSGLSSAGYKFLMGGKEYHSRQVATDGVNIQFGRKRKCPKISECERINLKPKYRYLYPLDSEIKKQIELLRKPYPKTLCGNVVKEHNSLTSEKVAV